MAAVSNAAALGFSGPGNDLLVRPSVSREGLDNKVLSEWAVLREEIIEICFSKREYATLLLESIEENDSYQISYNKRSKITYITLPNKQVIWIQHNESTKVDPEKQLPIFVVSIKEEILKYLQARKEVFNALFNFFNEDDPNEVDVVCLYIKSLLEAKWLCDTTDDLSACIGNIFEKLKKYRSQNFDKMFSFFTFGFNPSMGIKKWSAHKKHTKRISMRSSVDPDRVNLIRANVDTPSAPFYHEKDRKAWKSELVVNDTSFKALQSYDAYKLSGITDGEEPNFDQIMKFMKHAAVLLKMKFAYDKEQADLLSEFSTYQKNCERIRMECENYHQKMKSMEKHIGEMQTYVSQNLKKIKEYLSKIKVLAENPDCVHLARDLLELLSKTENRSETMQSLRDQLNNLIELYDECYESWGQCKDLIQQNGLFKNEVFFVEWEKCKYKLDALQLCLDKFMRFQSEDEAEFEAYYKDVDDVQALRKQNAALEKETAVQKQKQKELEDFLADQKTKQEAYKLQVAAEQARKRELRRQAVQEKLQLEQKIKADKKLALEASNQATVNLQSRYADKSYRHFDEFLEKIYKDPIPHYTIHEDEVINLVESLGGSVTTKGGSHKALTLLSKECAMGYLSELFEKNMTSNAGAGAGPGVAVGRGAGAGPGLGVSPAGAGLASEESPDEVETAEIKHAAEDKLGKDIITIVPAHKTGRPRGYLSRYDIKGLRTLLSRCGITLAYVLSVQAKHAAETRAAVGVSA